MSAGLKKLAPADRFQACESERSSFWTIRGAPPKRYGRGCLLASEPAKSHGTGDTHARIESCNRIFLFMTESDAFAPGRMPQVPKAVSRLC